MYRYRDLRIRKFRFEDIPLKIQWINDSRVNRYLHFDLPLEYEKTCLWYESVKNRADRFDGTIEYEGRPIGVIGLIGIDKKNKKAEDYITIGDISTRGKGIGYRAGILNALYAFEVLHLEKVFAFVEVGNEANYKKNIKIGFKEEGLLKHDIIYNGRSVDRYIMGLYRENFVIPPDVYWEEDG